MLTRTMGQGEGLTSLPVFNLTQPKQNSVAPDWVTFVPVYCISVVQLSSIVHF